MNWTKSHYESDQLRIRKMQEAAQKQRERLEQLLNKKATTYQFTGEFGQENSVDQIEEEFSKAI